MSEREPKGRPAVLLVCLSARFGGADVRVLQTARALAARDWRFRVAALAGSPLAAALASDGLPAAGLARRRGDPRLALDLAREARGIAAGVVDAHNMQSQYWAVAAAVRAGVRGRVATVHSVYRDSLKPGPGRRQLHEGALLAMRRAGAEFVAVSSNVKADLLRLGVPETRLTLSWNGLEPLAIPPLRSPAFDGLGWPRDAFVAAMIGRLEEVKGHALLLAALARAVDAGDTRLRLLIVGDGRDEAHLRGLVARWRLKDRVRFTGFRSDVPAILAGVDLLCMPSRTEGLSFAILEACRQGVPILVPNAGWAREVFRADETALFAADLEPSTLAAALARAGDDRAGLGRISAAARRLYEERFTVERMMEGTLAAYRAAAGRGEGGAAGGAQG